MKNRKNILVIIFIIIILFAIWGYHRFSNNDKKDIMVEKVIIEKGVTELKYGESFQFKTIIEPENATSTEIIWTSSNPTLLKIEEDGTATVVSNEDGEVVITATSKEIDTISDSINIKNKKVENHVEVESLKLDRESIDLNYGDSFELSLKISPSNATNKNVTWTSSDSSLVTVDSNGNIKAIKNENGTATITVTTVDGSKTATVKVTVKKVDTIVKVTGVKVDKSSITLNYNKTAKITATVLPSNATNKNVTWTSSDSSLVTVDSNGNIKAVKNKNGTATITVKTVEGSKTATVKVTVKKVDTTVKVTFMRNSTSSDTTSSSQTFTHGKSGQSFSAKGWSKTGYTLLGWSTSKTATSATYSVNEKVIDSWINANSPSITLYAVWKANKLTVNYYSNYATSSFSGALNTVGASKNVLVRTTIHYYDEDNYDGLWNYSTSGSSTYLGRTGYTATGYYGTSTSGGTLVKENEHFETGQAMAKALGKDLAKGDVTVNVYPQWRANMLTIKYAANGGSVNTNSDNYKQDITTYTSVWKYDGGKQDLINFSTFGLYRDGYTRKDGAEWNTKADGSGTSFDQDVEYNLADYSTAIKNGDKTITLYAQWTIKSYTVTYNANGGSVSPASKGANYNTSVTLPTPTRSGYTFNGWYTASSGGTKIGNAGANYKVTKNITLYAQWIAKTVKVTGVKVDKSAITLDYNKTAKITATVSPSNATNKNVTWTSSDSSLVTVDSNGNIKAVGNQNATTIITVKTVDGSKTATVKVTVKKQVKPTGVSIKTSGDSTLYLNSSNDKSLQLTATVLPSNATNKNVTWTSSNPAVAEVANGKVTGKSLGTAIITVKTVDGSKTSTLKVTVMQKNIIVITASAGVRMNDWFKTYTANPTNNFYSINNGTLKYCYLSGSGFSYQTHSGLTCARDYLKNKYTGKESYVELSVFFTLTGNEINKATCDDIKKGIFPYKEAGIIYADNKYTDQARRYNEAIKSIVDMGYISTKGYVISHSPLNTRWAYQDYDDKICPNCPEKAKAKKIVYSHDENACKSEYRSAYKYWLSNQSMKKAIDSNNYKYLKFIDNYSNFVVKVPGENVVEFTWKNDYDKMYKTEDALHWDEGTTKLYMQFAFDTAVM